MGGLRLWDRSVIDDYLIDNHDAENSGDHWMRPDTTHRFMELPPPREAEKE
jgi:hypothetical protein